MALDITIRTIEHREQRYQTPGDYYEGPTGTTNIRISELNNSDYEFLVAVHELIESYLVKRRGISLAEIDKFDNEYEEKKKDKEKDKTSEPGSDDSSPYRKEHLFASEIEQRLAVELGVKWEDYDRSCLELLNKK